MNTKYLAYLFSLSIIGCQSTDSNEAQGKGNPIKVTEEKIFRDKNILLPKVNTYQNDFIHDQSFYIPEEVIVGDFVGDINLITTDKDGDLTFSIIGNQNRFRIASKSDLNEDFDEGRKTTSNAKKSTIFTKHSTQVGIEIGSADNMSFSSYNFEVEAKLNGTDIKDIATFSVNVIDEFKTFFIDSEDGNDDNNGTTPELAWKSVSKIQNTTLNPGEAIFLKRGGVWDQTITLPNSGTRDQPIVVSAYGSGNKPKLDIKDKAIGIVNLNKQSNIIVHNLEITGNARIGIYGTQKKNQSDEPSKNLIFNYLYVHEVDPKDEPERRTSSHGIQLSHTPEDVKILNSEFFYLNMEAIYISSRNAEIGYNDISYIDLANAGGDGIQLNNVAYNYHVHHNVIDHSNSEGGKGGLVCSHRIKTTGDYNAAGLFEYNVIYGGPNDTFGFTTESRTDIVRYNIIQYDHTRNATQYALARINKQDDYKSALPRFGIKGAVTAYYNIFEGFSAAAEVATNDTHSFFNNVFLKNESKYLLAVQGGKTPTIKFANNIIMGSQDLVRNSRSLSTDVTLDSTYNLYSESGLSALGLGEINANPMFFSSADGDYKLRDSSPAINSGLNINTNYMQNILTDFSGASITTTSDIGLFDQ